MKIKIRLLISSIFFLLKSPNLSGQVILNNNYKCIKSEIPGRGHGLTNGIFTFYIDAKSRDIYTLELEREFLLNYKKTKDNLYYSTGKNGDQFYYEIVIPESLFVLTLTSTVNNLLFNQYSVALLREVRKQRNRETQIYFIRKNGMNCY